MFASGLRGHFWLEYMQWSRFEIQIRKKSLSPKPGHGDLWEMPQERDPDMCRANWHVCSLWYGDYDFGGAGLCTGKNEVELT